MTKPAQLRELDDDELERRLEEGVAEYFNLRFQVVTGQLDNTSRIREVRREIARIKTILREREIALAEELERGEATAQDDVAPEAPPFEEPGWRRRGRRRRAAGEAAAGRAVDEAEGGGGAGDGAAEAGAAGPETEGADAFEDAGEEER
jgi:large subunit ribosomal protein L29